MKLTDFVTYTRAEFHPGPNLNMIIGPNGTGKSTLVCAICLGLGWQTSHLGRAKDIGEFVKHGAKRAEIEIELAAHPGEENPIIRTRITKEGNKADFSISGRKSNKKGVLELAHSFSIQVDNLCQFLPQDRVVEFAALSPVDLLTQTQRAAAPEYMSEWHDKLKELRKQQKTQQSEQQGLIEILKTLEERHRLQEADVARLREREVLKDRIKAMEKLRPFPAYQVATDKFKEAKARKRDAANELKELERRVEPNLRAATKKQEYVERTEKVVSHRSRLVERGGDAVKEVERKIKAVDEKLQGCVDEIEAEKNTVKATRQNIPRLNQDIARIERALQSPPEEFDAAEMNAQMREKTRLAREVEEKIRELQGRGESLATQIKQRHQIIEERNKEKEGLRSQAGQQASKLKRASNDAARVWDWIQRNKTAFQSDVYGPPIVECTLKSPRHAAAVESMIPDGDKMSFTLTSQADMKMLLDKISEMRLRDVNLRLSNQPLAAFQKPNVSQEQLRQYGLDGWLIDLLDGPDPVLAMLCDNRNIHQMGYAPREINEAQFNALKGSPIGSWVTPSQSYQITRRREYGDSAVSTRVQALKQPRFFTDVPVDRQLEQDIDRVIRETEGEIEELGNERKSIMEEGRTLTEERKQHHLERKEIEDEKNKQQRALSEFNGLSVKLESQKAKLEKAMEGIAGYRARVRVVVDKADKLQLEKGQLALDYATAVDAFRNLHMQLLEVQIMRIEANSDLEQVKAQHAEESRLVTERRKEVEALQVIQDKAREEGQALAQKCLDLGASFTELEREIYDEYDGEKEAGEKWTVESLETEIQSHQARLEMTHGGGNENTINEFERRQRDIEQRRSRVHDLGAALDKMGDEITEIRNRWEPELDELVGKISEAFKENFDKINCAGEVAVHKDEEFEQWAIQIRVKFRYGFHEWSG